MNAPHDLNTAYKAAVRMLSADAAINSVTVEFVMKTTGLTKFLKVFKNDAIEVLSAEQVAAELEAA